MVIDVRSRRPVALGEILAAIVGDVEVDAEHVNTVVVGRIDADLAVIERPRAEGVDLLPGFALVFGAKDAAASRLSLPPAGCPCTLTFVLSVCTTA